MSFIFFRLMPAPRDTGHPLGMQRSGANVVADVLHLDVDLNPLGVGVELAASLDHQDLALVLRGTSGKAAEHHAEREVIGEVLLQVEVQCFLLLDHALVAFFAPPKGDLFLLRVAGGDGGKEDERHDDAHHVFILAYFKTKLLAQVFFPLFRRTLFLIQIL